VGREQPLERIRNFAIIAHIDHGKSTLADRLLQITGAVSEREMRQQFLDKMDIERERGITIKAQTVALRWTSPKGENYLLNLIDTPGHVDFGYEVSRALAACEGVLLVVDAVQGVEAQTLANVYLAIDAGLDIVPVVNKIDLPGADPERVLEQLESNVGVDITYAQLVSAKTGEGIAGLIEALVEAIPHPKDNREGPLQALIFDSWFDAYVGVVILVRVKAGVLKKGEKIRFMATGSDYDVLKLGIFTPHEKELNELAAGEVGFIIANVKTLADAKVGDTVTHAPVMGKSPASSPLPGFKEVKPMVFSGIYPTDSADYEELRDALEKLRLNDVSFTFEPETSAALGFGFRCGFLGLLHMEVIHDRLEREYNLDLVITAPSVVYEIRTRKGAKFQIHSPAQLPPIGEVEAIEEPIAQVTIHTPESYIGPVLKLCQDRRGTQVRFEYAGTGRIILTYAIPFAEVVYDFFDKLKSISRGYASMDYELTGWQEDDLVKLDILLNGEPVDALSTICHREASYHKGQALATRLKDFIPRQMYDVAIQAAIGSKVIARTTVKALRKDVTAKCYGGDISRKRKLLERQKEGKKRMKAVGTVEVPQEAFLAVLRLDGD
jgi:GTP-binding protein LepA